MSKLEISETEFSNTSNVLIADYANLLRRGLPKRETALWEEKVERQHPMVRSWILEAVEISDTLKAAIVGQHLEPTKVGR